MIQHNTNPLKLFPDAAMIRKQTKRMTDCFTPLKVVVAGHVDGVRRVASVPSVVGAFLSCGYDNMAHLHTPQVSWFIAKEQRSAEDLVEDLAPPAQNFAGHTGWVQDVTVVGLEGGSKFGVVTASRDESAAVWDPESGGLLHIFNCHDGSAITSAAAHENGDIVLGDALGRMSLYARNDEVVGGAYRLLAMTKSHEAPIHAIIFTSNGDVVSGSGDKLVIRWTRKLNLIRVYKAHPDVVKTLTEVSQGAVFAGDNSGLGLSWAIDGSVVAKLAVDSPIHSSAFAHHLNFLLTATEDRCVRVWNGAVCLQALYHTASCVSIALLARPMQDDFLDVAVATGNGQVVLWSSDIDHVSGNLTQTTFAKTLEAVEIHPDAIDDLEVEPVDSVLSFSLLTVGMFEGQVRYVAPKLPADSPSIILAWSRNQWQCVGKLKVVRAAADEGPPEKKLFEGKMYDFVLPIPTDTDETLFAVCNVGDDPYDAADDFVQRYSSHGVTYAHRAQIARHIIGETNGKMKTVKKPKGNSSSEVAVAAASSVPVVMFPVPLSRLIQHHEATPEQIQKILVKITTQNDSLVEPETQIPAPQLASLRETFGTSTPQPVCIAAALSAVEIAMRWPEGQRFPGVDICNALLVRGLIGSRAGEPITASLAGALFECVASSHLAEAMVSHRLLAILCLTGDFTQVLVHATDDGRNRLALNNKASKHSSEHVVAFWASAVHNVLVFLAHNMRTVEQRVNPEGLRKFVTALVLALVDFLLTSRTEGDVTNVLNGLGSALDGRSSSREFFLPIVQELGLISSVRRVTGWATGDLAAILDSVQSVFA